MCRCREDVSLRTTVPQGTNVGFIIYIVYRACYLFPVTAHDDNKEMRL